MKKRIGKKQLGRNTKTRTALLKSLVVALASHESVITTKAKAVAVRPVFEKLLTTAKTGTVAARRAIHAYTQSDELVKKMVDDLGKRYADVMGGYTSVKPYGTRKGDNATLVTLTLTKKQAKVAKANSEKTSPAKAEAETKEKLVKEAKVAPVKETKVKTVKIAAKRAGKRGDR
jgi:large subunit ribosomal protein L17